MWITSSVSQRCSSHSQQWEFPRYEKAERKGRERLAKGEAGAGFHSNITSSQITQIWTWTLSYCSNTLTTLKRRKLPPPSSPHTSTSHSHCNACSTLIRSKSRSRKGPRHQTPTSLGEERSNQVKPTVFSYCAQIILFNASSSTGGRWVDWCGEKRSWFPPCLLPAPTWL